jgi:hypothetical protein
VEPERRWRVVSADLWGVFTCARSENSWAFFTGITEQAENRQSHDKEAAHAREHSRDEGEPSSLSASVLPT